MYQTEKIVATAVGFAKNEIGRSAFYQRLTQLITEEMACTRASLWTYNSELKDSIECECLYDSTADEYQQGACLSDMDFRPYFDAMRENGLIVASHAREHPATSCFNELYFDPLAIVSLLDVEIVIEGEAYGLFCCEQTSLEKEWQPQDIEFLRKIGVLIGLSLRKAQKRV